MKAQSKKEKKKRKIEKERKNGRHPVAGGHRRFAFKISWK
jgi:hypothetical protein